MVFTGNRRAGLLAAAIVLSGVAFAGEKADADRAKIAKHFAGDNSSWTWVFYGDSNTQGAAHTHGWRGFPEIFSERIRWELANIQDAVIQSGTSGATSVYLLDGERYQFHVRRYRPSVVFLLVGSNDISRVKDPILYRANMEQFVDRIRADGAIPILNTYNTIQPTENPVTDWQKECALRYRDQLVYMDIMRQVAADKDVILVDHFVHWPDAVAEPEKLDAWLAETLHPGPKGHQEIAKLICKELGLYDDNSACLTLDAGGGAAVGLSRFESYEPYFPDFDGAAWDIEYRAADGTPGVAWKSDYPAGKLSVAGGDGAPLLVIDNTSTEGPAEYATFSLRDADKLANQRGVVLMETRLRFPKGKQDDRPYHFYCSLAAGTGENVAEAILLLSENKFAGSTGEIGNTEAGSDFFRLRLAFAPARRTAGLWIDSHYLGTFALKRVTEDGARLLLGDGSGGVGGVTEMEYFRVTSVPAR